MARKTTICTAIPYVNATPHIGNILTDLSGDVTARYMRMRGADVFFQVGTDENGLKIKEAAEAQGRDPHEFVDEIAGRFQTIFDRLGISYDDFLRTTEPRHIRASQEVFRRLKAAGYVYKGNYEGWYDVSTETFFKEEDLIDGKSPDGNPVRWVSEQNWFFRMSAFEVPLLAHIEANPGFIRPANRRNEVLSFIKQGLRDVAISRQNPGWGIPVPDDEGQVIYVWFDAVINYISVFGWPDADWREYWPAKVQWLGKDILTRFHATLWPAILMGLDLPLPEAVVAHGWVLLGGEKISKSRGNVVEPIPLAEDLAARAGCAPEIAIDVVRHYLTATMSLENDSLFTYEAFDERYNVDLANDIGNALNRTLAMAHRFINGIVPNAEPEPEALSAIETAKTEYAAAMDEYRIDRAVAAAFGLVRFLNKYIDTRAPWALNKAGDPALAAVLRSMLLMIRAAEGLVRSTIPHVADAIAAQLSLPALTSWDDIGKSETMPTGHILGLPSPIFPRLEKEKKPLETRTEPVTPKPNVPEPPQEVAPIEWIDIADFAKVKLRVGRIFEAEPVEKSDKLFKLQVVIGEEKRQIVAGIRANYTPEDLIGRQVVVVMNLKPAKLRGVESQGMLLAATDENGGAILLQPEKEAPEGTNVR
ncbi:methionine--tRNA ligase [soil metagenome]